MSKNSPKDSSNNSSKNLGTSRNLHQVTPSNTKVRKENQDHFWQDQYGFLEAPLVRQADGELKNKTRFLEKGVRTPIPLQDLHMPLKSGKGFKPIPSRQGYVLSP